eukprot:m.1668150 g.1668150  ORF g.1668150 m.1668150 type:complete len:58 (+) comp151401_c0_seq1:19-192(+)
MLTQATVWKKATSKHIEPLSSAAAGGETNKNHSPVTDSNYETTLHSNMKSPFTNIEW